MTDSAPQRGTPRLGLLGDLAGAEAGQGGQFPIVADALAVTFGQQSEVGGERAKSGQEPLDELALVVYLEQRIGGPLPADGRGPLRA